MINKIFSNGNIVTINEYVVRYNDDVLPRLPNGSLPADVSFVNARLYINGYEWRGDCWRRTLRALWHLWF